MTFMDGHNTRELGRKWKEYEALKINRDFIFK